MSAPRLLLAVVSLLLLACGGCHGASRREPSDTLELFPAGRFTTVAGDDDHREG